MSLVLYTAKAANCNNIFEAILVSTEMLLALINSNIASVDKLILLVVNCEKQNYGLFLSCFFLTL